MTGFPTLSGAQRVGSGRLKPLESQTRICSSERQPAGSLRARCDDEPGGAPAPKAAAATTQLG